MRKLLPLITIALCVTLAAPSYGVSTPPLAGYAARAGGTIFNVPIPREILAIPMTDASGKTFTLASLKGKTTVLTDFLTLCSEICPMTTVNMRDIGDAIAKAKLGGRFESLEVTVDPKRDTPKRLRSYQALFNDSSWTVATGSVKGISTLWSWFGLNSQLAPAGKGAIDWLTGKPTSYDVIHANAIVIIGPDLHWRWLDLGAPALSSPKSKHVLPTKLFKYLSSAGKASLLKPEEPFWTTGAVYGALNEIFKIKIGS